MFRFSIIIAVLLVRRSNCLNCYVCHSRQTTDCSDPFIQRGNTSGYQILNECDRVRKVGESVVAASNAIGGLPPPYTPLEGTSHVCYKITMGQHAVRGCAKPDFCTNMTEVCDVCNTDGCNSAPQIYRSINLLLLIMTYPLLLTSLNLSLTRNT